MAGSLWEKEGESGLLDNFEFTITASYFATNEKYTDDAGEHPWLLNWEGTTDSLDVPVMHIWYSLGKGWVSTDDGLTIHHESDPDHGAGKYFNKTSQYYKIIARCRDEFNMAPVLEKRGLDPFVASAWEGAQFRIVNESQPGIRGAAGKDKQMPVAFIGFVDGDSSNGSSGKAKAAAPKETPQEKMNRLKAEKAAAKEAPAVEEGGGEKTLRDQVMEILAAEDDFDIAQGKCLDLPDIMDDDDLVSGLMDADGLYAEARANA